MVANQLVLDPAADLFYWQRSSTNCVSKLPTIGPPESYHPHTEPTAGDGGRRLLDRFLHRDDPHLVLFHMGLGFRWTCVVLLGVPSRETSKDLGRPLGDNPDCFHHLRNGRQFS